MISTAPKKEKAILIGLILKNQLKEEADEYLDELQFLALTSGAHTIKVFIQKMDTPHPATFVGKGKINEIKQYVKENEIDMAIFDDDLEATQIRNIERILECKILDRSNLILDIFASRARTSHAKTQVELAQYQYLLPRLTRMWTHLERQKGGIGMRGPGETQIETDRRIIKQKINLLKKKLLKIDNQKIAQRSNRGNMVRVALVGYTNVGKSTIMNILSKSDVFAENKLFATLDTTVRKVVINSIPFLLTDTVGFIRKLPHQLIESFKSTLDEVREADVLIHVVDVSQTSFNDHYDVVNETLNDLLQNEKPTIMVFNKIDKINKNKLDLNIEQLKKSWLSKINNKHVFISATNKLNLDQLRKMLHIETKIIHKNRFPYNR
jgi:GTP-binding protein HflX